MTQAIRVVLLSLVLACAGPIILSATPQAFAAGGAMDPNGVQ